MSNSLPNSNSQPNTSNSPDKSVFGELVAIAGLLGALLYFTGWVYLIAYFDYFQIKVSSLDLPVESFLIRSLQVFLGSRTAMGWTFLSYAVTMIAIHLLSLFFDWVADPASSLFTALFSWTLNVNLRSLRRNFIPLLFTFPNPGSLRSQFIIFISFLLALNFLSRNRGLEDARMAAFGDTSLPVATIIAKEESLALGRSLANPLLSEAHNICSASPSIESPLKDYKILGDWGWFCQLSGEELNSIPQENSNQSQPFETWRLLIERNNWIYLFRTLPPDQREDKTARPEILVIRGSDGGDQMMILTPKAFEEEKQD